MSQAANVPRFPSIPVPTNDVNGLYQTCMALKQAVDQMLGSTGTERMPHIHIRSDQPIIESDGDFWLSTGLSTTLNVSYGGKWHVIGTLA
jgi:hypothetical protein